MSKWKREKLIAEAKVDLNTGAATVTDFTGKTYHHKAGQTGVETIQDAIKQLQYYIDTGYEKPGVTRQNMKAYRCLLAAKDPEKACREYLNLRWETDFQKSHVDCVKELGYWNDNDDETN